LARFALIRGLDIETLYLTHYGAYQDVEQHLNELEERLQDRADWIKPYFDQQADPKEITPEFEKYVREELRENGITDEEQLQQYENANPGWMSVAGLLRYWKKRKN